MTDDSGALDLFAGLRLEDGRAVADAATLEQWDFCRSFLDRDSPLRRHFLLCARGFGKTTLLGGLALAAMIRQLRPGSTAYALAADRDQGRLLVDSIRGFVQRDELLASLVKIDAYKVSIPSRDVILEILAADAASAYGLRPALLIVDELCQWAQTPGARELWTAVTSALPKVEGSRLAVLSTPGDPGHWSRRVYDAACASPMWKVTEIKGPPPWISQDEIDEQRARLLPSEFTRLWLGEWASGEDRLVNPADLEACLSLPGPIPAQPGARYAAGLDIGVANDRTALVVAHREDVRDGDGRPSSSRVVVDQVMTWEGTRDVNVDLTAVEEAIRELAAAYRFTLFYDPSQAVEMTQRLERFGVRCVRVNFTASSVGQIAGTLFQLLRNRALALPRHPILVDELLTVRLRPNAYGVLRVDHLSGRHDDHVIALGLAAQGLVEGRSGFDEFMAALAAEPDRLGLRPDIPDGHRAAVLAARMGAQAPLEFGAGGGW